jgi:phage repressor protein C with HTH and peptisase S24 domain
MARAMSSKARRRDAYSRALNIDPAWLLYGHGPRSRWDPSIIPGSTPQPSCSDSDRSDDIGGTPNGSSRFLEAPDFHFLSKDIPVLGTVECGSDGAFNLNEGPIDHVRRPPGQMNRKGIYCIYVEGSSMEPVYETGDLVYVDPHRPPQAGRDVVIQLVARLRQARNGAS